MSPKTLKKPKKLTETELKKKADEVFSRFVRLTHANKDGVVQCYTCPFAAHWKKLQCGHFVSRKAIAVRYDERNARPQCYFCNSQRFGNGRPTIFGPKLMKEYGDEIVSELYALAAPLCTNFDYQSVIDKYSPLVEKLVDERGY